MEWLYIIVIGIVVGWLAGQITKGRGFGLIGNIVIGVLGSVVGRWLSEYFNFSLGSGTIGTILTGTLGAVVVIFIVNLVKK